jgi:hypothetical protein
LSGRQGAQLQPVLLLRPAVPPRALLLQASVVEQISEQRAPRLQPVHPVLPGPGVALMQASLKQAAQSHRAWPAQPRARQAFPRPRRGGRGRKVPAQLQEPREEQ